MHRPSARSAKVPLLAALALGMTIAVAGCSSETASMEPSKDAGNLGTRVCVVNNTSIAATLAFSKKDTAQEGTLPAGGRLCGEGTFGVGRDVIGTVTWAEPAWKTEFSASNPWMGPPEARVSEDLPENTILCLGQGFDVNESLAGDNGIVSTKLTRLADGQWKEFELIFTPSSQPSPNGERRLVSGFRKCNTRAAAAA